ncbi:MAG: hypothetical protein RQ982_03370 [Gammaproteobacteria bacterium]|nr:hypothetical protein [Gammaproteobacteria bacterium]
MKCNTFITKGRAVVAVGLLTGGMGIATTVQATGCVLTPDPFLSNVMGMPVEGYFGHPCAQPHPGPSIQTLSADEVTTFVTTPEGQFPAQDPNDEPPGSNFLMTVYENARDLSDREMPNTLPSTPDNPYNLHDGPVLTRAVDKTNPEDDLDSIIDAIKVSAKQGNFDPALVQRGIDILEGNPVGRAYDGFPMLHYNGPRKTKVVEPIYEDGVLVGGNVDVNMIYFNQHIESDTGFIDPSAVQEVPYTVTYNVKILNRGMEDFSPMNMNFNRIVNPMTGEDMRGPFHVSMDMSYFPMLEEGTEYTVKIKQNKGKYFNLIYTWGWRIHPPRVQVAENALKTAGPDNWTLPQWENAAFCQGGFDDNCDPAGNPEHRAYAISQIGDLSPAKRMWNIFNDMKNTTTALCEDLSGKALSMCQKKYVNKDINIKDAAADLSTAFLDWVDRTKLPTGVAADPDATLTLFYVNNTMYGSRQGVSGDGSKLGPASYKGINNGGAHDWDVRPYLYKTTLLNGDHFPHGYMNVDFGGSRGWENHFQTTDPTTSTEPHPVIPAGSPANGEPYDNPANIVAGEENLFPINRGGAEEYLQPSPRNLADPDNGNPQLGSGCFFTFGRNHAWPNAGGPWGGIMTPPVAADGTPGMHKVEITYNFEPSQRLKIYQFDPLHHDVAIYSLH